MNALLRKLDRMLTAMVYAEAGDLDRVKEMLGKGEEMDKSGNGQLALFPASSPKQASVKERLAV